MDSACIGFTTLHCGPLVQTKGQSKLQSIPENWLHSIQRIRYKSWKWLTMQTAHPNWWPTDQTTNESVHPVFICFSFRPMCRASCVLEHLQTIVSVGLMVSFFFELQMLTHGHFHHPTFLPNKVSPTPSRLRSFRETIIPLCKSAGNRRNWWHHGCQS